MLQSESRGDGHRMRRNGGISFGLHRKERKKAMDEGKENSFISFEDGQIAPMAPNGVRKFSSFLGGSPGG